MAAVRIDGKELALKVRAEVADDVRAWGGPVCLATVLVGDDPASHTYVGSKHKASAEAGIDSRDHRFPSDTPESDILELIADLNADDAVDGILVQLPLPEHMDESRVLRSVEAAKDVDGFHPLNAGLLFLGEPFLVPATPSGVMVMLVEHGVELKGKEAVVIGRSEIVGKPMAMLLLAEHATVTICHSRTADLAEHTRRADVLVAAVGRRGLVTPDMVKPGATVIDVGVNRTEEGKLVGDVDPAVFEVAGLMTPVPGGVGPMTIAMLLRNTLTAAQHRRAQVASAGS
jgi:methylenetetrahydrofolate dehydrogenase (NADP+) / methenyltetrahydrofolate cyclohydrolase